MKFVRVLKNEKKGIIFLLLTGLVVLGMTILNLLNFILSTIIDFPVWIGVLWGIASIGSIALYSIIIRSFKWQIIPAWLILSSIFVIVYLVLTNWNKFLICFTNFYQTELEHLIPGFLLALLLLAITRLILWGFKLIKNSNVPKKQD